MSGAVAAPTSSGESEEDDERSARARASRAGRVTATADGDRRAGVRAGACIRRDARVAR